ncbi:MAG: hypothetical protein AAGE52_07135 [Myxococcota bacterium]
MCRLAAFWVLCVAASAVAQSPPEPAAEPPGPPEEEAAPATDAAVTRVAVLVVSATETHESAADGLTEVLIGAIAARGGAEIVGKEEVQAILQQGEARSLECVTSPACLGRLAVQLQVDEAVVGTLSARDGVWSFDLNRVDVQAGETLGRTFREVEGDLGAVAGELLQATEELYRPPVRDARLRIAANAPARITIDGRDVGDYTGEVLQVEGLAPGTYRLRAEPLNEDHLPWEREVVLEADADLQIEASLPVPAPIAPELPGPEPQGISPVLWVGAGAAVAGAVMAVGFGVRSQRDVGEGANRAQAKAFVEDRERDARIANASLVVMAAGVVTTIVGLFLSDFGVEASAIATPEGGMVLFRGRL